MKKMSIESDLDNISLIGIAEGMMKYLKKLGQWQEFKEDFFKTTKMSKYEKIVMTISFICLEKASRMTEEEPKDEH